MDPSTEKLRKKYMDNPPEGMTSEDIRRMSEDDLLDMDYFLNEDDEYSVTSEPLNPLHRATHSECRSHPYEKVNPLLRATS